MSDMTEEDKAALLSEAVTEVSRAIAAAKEAAIRLNDETDEDTEAYIERQREIWEPEAYAAIIAFEQWRRKKGILGFVTL